MEILDGKRVILRSLTLDDAEKVEEYASDYEISKTTLNIPHPYPKGSARDFIRSVLEAQKEGRNFNFAIICKENRSFIGLIGLRPVTEHKRGEVGYWIGKPFWGNGYGTEAAKLIIKYGFEVLNLNRIYAAAFTSNPGSWRIMEKCGMKHEGIFRNHVCKDGKPLDLTYYGILKEEYKVE
ncbi:GNAT family N-acetyltransferase [Bacillus sp. DTU_2020_1000418_1_SI_GHA_SEK_038]|uniref:GNAT family N-acetyltransferase n=1 Tax=Bacillus sp. DTU_2020_1000418_1_SI_GHA_SEK_038 TaxID=3077585 RepID=UPI0028E750C0|nr:GNAT family N-acetyltransferase [Bacillus sp. DTU_2020_1000418_1_SI_GHA_SEK_038]WNS76348.1 GNAT family N-acetyltransferase [Bacillus sp. DTU_2020_1000418_1_SI_GHA_SEK_038]